MSGGDVRTGRVAAVVVSHDGARWLPQVIEAVAAQTRPVDHVVCVDTGSGDQSVELLEAAFGTVHSAGEGTSYPQAIDLALVEIAERASDVEWVWLLHDDSAPAPDALARLLEHAEADPEVGVLGPKLREWPSLRRLLEVGITISGTGRRETGLERGEYDQGQHDDVRRVLAVNTAGMLVRHDVLVGLGGFDEQLPVFGNDLDFGWRAAAAGHRTVVVPAAVVFHAEAAHRGVRRTDLTGRHTHFQERRAALWTLFANSRARALPFQAVRLTLATVLRAVGFLLVRAPGQALDEVLALVTIRAGSVLRARRERQGRATAPYGEVRALLAPPWLPYRHGLDAVSDLAAAVTNQASDVAERRRAAALERDAAANPGRTARHVEVDDDVLEADSSWLARFFTNPVALVAALAVAAMLVGARSTFGLVAGGLSGGALSPTPDGVGSWWHLHLDSWHALGSGTGVPAPPYIAPLALLASLGGPGVALLLVMLVAAPLGMLGAWRFLRVVGRLVDPAGLPSWLLLWGAVCWGLVPAVSGAWGEGRLGAVIAAALLPWLGHAMLGFLDPEAERRWRAAWRTGVLLALVVAGAPPAWPVLLVLMALAVAGAAALAPSVARSRAAWGPPLLGGLLPAVLLAPWALGSLTSTAAEGLLLDTGRPPGAAPSVLDVLAGRLGDVGAPTWVGLVPLVLAVLALVPTRTRGPVLVCWSVALVTALALVLFSRLGLDVAAGSLEPGLALPVALLQGAWLTAAVLGGLGALDHLSGARGRSRQVWLGAGAVVAAVAVLVPLIGAGWFTLGHTELSGTDDSAVPAYMQDSSRRGPEHGVLVITGTTSTGLGFTVRRDDGVTVGEDEVLTLSARDDRLTEAVRQLVSDPESKAPRELAAQGIEYVVLPAPADGDVAAVLDATGGLDQASAEDRTTRAWRVSAPLGDQGLTGTGSWWHRLLLVVQLLGVLVALVQCAPSRPGARERAAEGVARR
ncbi:glycosyltransferase [Nocardioides acrostichi]|uniref:Glycosyltransferase family 2 protein n=1 Tax=Nocardioides acrostichi TaxID=2784339 RepID=A0A930Y620_9ACTN|nr:glycosyltransferase family 2 protein [Nocardioides acrostichi]MBF4161855.1 glycosyltransferase family 2 protein [Nocardioides acrostichi]